jgi:translocator protein
MVSMKTPTQGMQHPNHTPNSPLRRWLGLAGWLLLSFSASATAVFVSTDGWYTELAKPPWNPPSWVFGPAWTFLYALMAIAAWRVWLLGGWTRRKVALGLFVAQWALNALWTPLFFGLQKPGWALVEILVLLLAIFATTRAFWRVDRTACLLLLPYAAWVAFATALNFAIWQLN